MSEARPVRGILVAHGTMADGLVDAVRQITGAGDEVLVAMSNRGLAPKDLARRIEEQIGDGPTLIFTDLQSGSCGFVARQLCHDRRDVAVLTGVNLPLLLDFVVHRDLPIGELVPRLLDRGHAGICCTPSDLEDHARRAVSS